MRNAAPTSGTTWVSLALFYIRLPPREGDPDKIQFRAEVLFGEGTFVTEATRPSLSNENLGDGIHVLHVTNTIDEIAARLSEMEFEYRMSRNGGDSSVGLFSFGLTRRPPVVGLANRNGWVRAPSHGAHRIHQFVRVDKVALLRRISEATADPDEKRPANRMLDALARVAGFDLRAEQVQWLGDVLVIEHEKGVAWWNSAKDGEQKSCRAINVHVRPEAEGLIQVQVRVLGLDEMCLLDQLVEWRDDDRAPKRIDLEEEVGGVVLRTWLNGRLIQEDRYALLRGVSTRVDLVTATYTIRDRLTSKLERALHVDAAAPSLLKQAQAVSPSGMSTRTGSNMNEEPWGGLNNTANDVLDFVSPPAADYTYFSANPPDRTRAVLHFANLISKARDAYLVDPWFDAVGAEALIARVRGDVRLTIVTNLPSPDHTAQKSRLVDFLRSAAVLGLPSNLKVVCVRQTDSAAQVFHDRVLLLRDEHRWQGFILTNSFSGFATRYPLFVVETPLATTARMLEDTEQLLDQPKLVHEQLWPPPRTSSAVDQHLRRGTFAYWEVFLRGLVPRRGRSEAEWLQAAQARGFLQETDDGLSWRMNESGKAEALGWLLEPKAPRKHRCLRARERVRRRWPAIGRRRPFDIGRAVIVLGELVARGLDVTPNSIAERLQAKDAPAIEKVLRETFRDGSDPTLLQPGVPIERLQLRQSLKQDVELLNAAVAGMHLWNANFWRVGRSPAWGRHFAYAVLAHLDPARAVRTCESLLDADFLMPFVYPLAREGMIWTEPVARAFVGSRSPVLRAYGAQLLTQRELSSPGNHMVARPADVSEAIIALRSAGIGEDDLACYLAVWGAHGDQHDAPGCASVSNALAERLEGLSPPRVANIVELLLDRGLQGREFLAALVEALDRRRGAGAVAFLRLLIHGFAERFREETGDLFFSKMDIPTTITMASAAQLLAAQLDTTPAAEIRAAADLEHIQKRFSRLTPLRRRPGFHRTDVTLGWVLLWEGLASAASSDAGPGHVTLPAATDMLVREYLATPGVSTAREVRAALRRLIDGVDTADATSSSEDADE